eukprot:Pgem_evm1s19156
MQCLTQQKTTSKIEKTEIDRLFDVLDLAQKNSDNFSYRAIVPYLNPDVLKEERVKMC